jgi:hypothetical protein
MFFFATVVRFTRLMEPSIGPCPFCQGQDCMDLIEQKNHWQAFGCCPTTIEIEEMVHCRQCDKRIKAAYYTLRTNVAATRTTSYNVAPTAAAPQTTRNSTTTTTTTTVSATPIPYSDAIMGPTQEWNEIAPPPIAVTATPQEGHEFPTVVGQAFV